MRAMVRLRSSDTQAFAEPAMPSTTSAAPRTSIVNMRAPLPTSRRLPCSSHPPEVQPSCPNLWVFEPGRFRIRVLLGTRFADAALLYLVQQRLVAHVEILRCLAAVPAKAHERAIDRL